MEFLNLSKAVGLQASVLAPAIIQDKLINISQHAIASELLKVSTSFREWVELQNESGQGYQGIENQEELDDKQHRMLRNKKKDTIEEIIEDNYKLKGEIQELREKINEEKFDEIDTFHKKHVSLEKEFFTLKESQKKRLLNHNKSE